MIVPWLSSIFIATVAGLSLFGLLGMVTIWYFWKNRDKTFPCPELDEDQLPNVTVQLPLFNERYVVGRLIRAATNLDYPRDRLQIQILDDSTDDTTSLARDLVQRYQEQGFDISLLHRRERSGFKAGALEAGLARAVGEYVAVFDADFEPGKDFLRNTIPHFIMEPALGMIQTRWGHLNGAESALTAAQTIALDKHFVMEQSVRHRANLFPKFNGSAGVWRRACLIDAGGWEDDTVCEDLCLSTRAILRGWAFRYLNEVVAPAELPQTISAYKNQQSRWAKGSTQCLLKFGPAILTSKRHSRIARVYALTSMAGYATHLLLLMLLLVQVPLIYLGYKPPSFMIIFGIASIAQPLLFVLGQRLLYGDWLRRLRYLPALLLIAIGLAASNSRAIMEAIFGRQNDFVRTPKSTPENPGPIRGLQGSTGYKLPFDRIILLELGLAAYALAGMIICLYRSNYWPILFMSTCMLGFGYVAFSSIREQVTIRRGSILPTR